MGFIGDLFNSDKGAGWQAQSANLTNPVGVGQAQSAINQSAQGIDQQQAFLNALAAQNGIGNQSSAVNNALNTQNALANQNAIGNQSAIAGQQLGTAGRLASQNGIGNQSGVFNQQQGLANQLARANGVGNQSSVFNQQQGLANQLGVMAQGGGPNPALTQLNQTTGQNIANQAALMAGQRGAGSNAGLLARQAAMEGGNLQQQAVGQAATQRANQQLAAIGALQGQQGALGSTAAQQVAQQQAQQNALAGLSTNQVGQLLAGQNAAANTSATQVGQLQNQQALAGNLAQQQVANQQGALNSYNSAAQGMQNSLLGSIQNQNANAISNAQQQNQANAAIASGNQKSQSGLLNGLLGAAGTALIPMTGGASAALAAAAHGGVVQGYADGGPVSEFGQMLTGNYKTAPTGQGTPAPNFSQLMDPNNANATAQASNLFTRGLMAQAKNLFGSKSAASAADTDLPPALNGDAELPPAPVMAANTGSLVEVGGRAKVKGDSRKNDIVPAMLSPGEVVLPRSVMNSKDPAASAAKFVAALMAKKNLTKQG